MTRIQVIILTANDNITLLTSNAYPNSNAGMSGDTIVRVQERVDRWGVANLPAIIPDEELGLLKQMSDFVEEVGTPR